MKQVRPRFTYDQIELLRDALQEKIERCALKLRRDYMNWNERFQLEKTLTLCAILKNKLERTMVPKKT